MTTYTSRGIPILEASDPADIPSRINPLAQLFHDRPGISVLTTTERNALTGSQLWHGRVIVNSTIDRLQRYRLSSNTWFDIADFTEIAALLATTGTPAALGTTASLGTSSSAARADHVHPLPAVQTYVPTLVNMTQGNGTVTGEYTNDGRWIDFWCRFVLGTTSAIAANPAFSVPVAAVSSFTFSVLDVYFTDSGINSYKGVGAFSGNTAVTLYTTGASGSFVQANNASPITFATGDSLELHGRYRRA